MTLAEWCIAAMLTLVYVPRAIVMRAQSRQPGGLDNHYPRDQQAKLEGVGRRAQAAEMNGFEAFAPFAVAVLIAEKAGARQQWVDWLALAFVGLRALYVAFYLGDKPTPRSGVWILGMATVAGLFGVTVLR